MEQVVVMILAGGQGRTSRASSRASAKPVPFGGKYRIIDFALSNCVGTFGSLHGRRVDPISLHSAQRAHRHRAPWDLDRQDGSVRLPATTGPGA
ncbi:MAG: hypothetical protein U0841_29670 [Chloroflexia bacterium]